MGDKMKALFSIATTFAILIQSSMADPSCLAETRTITSNGTFVKKEFLKQMDIGNVNMIKLNIDIDEAYFSFVQQDYSITGMIVLGPDYTLGNLSRSGFDENGRLKLSYVTPNKTYILDCTR